MNNYDPYVRAPGAGGPNQEIYNIPTNYYQSQYFPYSVPEQQNQHSLSQLANPRYYYENNGNAPLRKEMCVEEPYQKTGCQSYDQMMTEELSKDPYLEKIEHQPNSALESETSDSKEKIVPIDSTTSREMFYDFWKKVAPLTGNVDGYFAEIKKNLHFKISKVLSPNAMAGTYEKILKKRIANPRLAKKNWNEEEFLFLTSLITYYCVLNDLDCGALDDESWKYLGALYPGKHPDQLKTKWQNSYKVHLSKVPWSKIEDDTLVQIISEKGPEKHWREISIALNKLTGSKVYRHAKQCRERWINHLDPSKNRGVWLDSEDTNLLNLYLELGRKWSEISKRLGNRTENSVKNRWNSMLKKYKSEVEIEPYPKGASLEEAIAWERKIASLILEAKKNGLLTGPEKDEDSNQQLSGDSHHGDHAKSPMHSHSHSDIGQEFSGYSKKSESSWESKKEESAHSNHPHGGNLGPQMQNASNSLYENLPIKDHSDSTKKHHGHLSRKQSMRDSDASNENNMGGNIPYIEDESREIPMSLEDELKFQPNISTQDPMKQNFNVSYDSGNMMQNGMLIQNQFSDSQGYPVMNLMENRFNPLQTDLVHNAYANQQPNSNYYNYQNLINRLKYDPSIESQFNKNLQFKAIPEEQMEDIQNKETETPVMLDTLYEDNAYFGMRNKDEPEIPVSTPDRDKYRMEETNSIPEALNDELNQEIVGSFIGY